MRAVELNGALPRQREHGCSGLCAHIRRAHHSRVVACEQIKRTTVAIIFNNNIKLVRYSIKQCQRKK